MRMRFIKGGERKRAMIRGPVSEDTLTIWYSLTSMGYEPVGLGRYLLHVLFPTSERWEKQEKNTLHKLGDQFDLCEPNCTSENPVDAV
ncbi:hypothetical protein CMI37_31470 [Candidatus Pacearchaeota archaeon]|nr:hypothetical protein [Candidatus Pacearchaeota archaeon]|tara:strand:+ start:1115 stop:1378 length:264 start_codon:yes stop_codon:yes gene_type:complete